MELKLESLRDPLNELLAALGGLASSDVGYAFIALAAAGTIAMAIVQVIKEITPLRAGYQGAWFRDWIASRGGEFDKARNALSSDGKDSNVGAVEGALIELSTGGLARALYGLPTEDMVAQLKQTLPIILDEPKNYPAALILLSLRADAKDLDRIFQGQPDDGAANTYFDARARVTRRMERNLDGVRIALSDRWKLWMQVASLILTTIVVQLAVMFAGKSSAGVHWVAIPIGLLGGYFAPITRDLLAALQQLRHPTA